MKELLDSKIVPYVSFNKEQEEFIKKFTTVLNTPASKESIEKFNKFPEKKTFADFNELIEVINNHNQKEPNSYIDVPLELIRNHAEDHVTFEETLLKIYNTFSYFFGKNYGYKVVRALTIKENLKVDLHCEPTGGVTVNLNEGKGIVINIDEKLLSYDQEDLNHSWKIGYFATSKKYSNFMHEFGHALDFIHRINFDFYKEIDSISGLDLGNNKEKTVSDKYKIEYCDDLDKKLIKCPYRISTKLNKNQPSNSLNSYSLNNVNMNSQPDDKRSNIADLLEKFILGKVKNLKIPGNNQAEKDKFTKSMLLKIFINSDYGRSDKNDEEVVAEGFEYWLLTDEKFRDKAWEIWNEFFLEYLPAWKDTSIHFNK